MAKKVARLKEQELKDTILETTQSVLNQSVPSESERPAILVEIARINKREGENGIFPYSSYKVKIWSNDHEPAHFHVMKDGWDILFEIATGNLIRVEGRGSNIQDYDYITNNVKDWLQSQCAIMPSSTNQQNAMITWEQLHDEEIKQ